MRINGYRCDNCSDDQPISTFSTDGVPSGWLAVKVAALLFPQVFTFCSWRCLYQWSSNQLRKEAEKVSTEEVSV